MIAELFQFCEKNVNQDKQPHPDFIDDLAKKLASLEPQAPQIT